METLSPSLSRSLSHSLFSRLISADSTTFCSVNRYNEKRCQRSADLCGVLAFSEMEKSFAGADSQES